MRPAAILGLLLLALAGIDGALFLHARTLSAEQERALPRQRIAVASMGLSDLAVATEARYTRHPAVSDPMAPFMDHPGAIEHFPTGSFWLPPSP